MRTTCARREPRLGSVLPWGRRSGKFMSPATHFLGSLWSGPHDPQVPGPMCPPRRPKVKRRDGLDGQVRTGSVVCRRQSIVVKLAEGRCGILSHLICLALRSDLAAQKLIF